MISKKFQVILFLSIALNWLHFIECSVTKYYEVGPVFMNYFHSIRETAYYAFHLPFYVFLLGAFLLLKGGKGMFIPLGYYGILLFLEFHHFLRGAIHMSYYPGMITSFFFPIIGVLYAIELRRLWKKVATSK